MNEQLIEEGVKLILQGLGEDITREGLVETPKRVAIYCKQLFGGYEIDPKQYLKIFHEPNLIDKNMVVVEAPIYSFCEHHMALFHGHIYIGYIPHEKVIGISKLVRIARVFAKRLQIQERLTAEIADFIQQHLSPLGVAVHIKAEHTCYSDDTEILTDSGWKLFKELTDKDLVAQATNEDIPLISFVKPINRQCFYYSGNMIRFKNLCVDLLVTPEHRMVFQTQWQGYNNYQYDIKKAKDLLNKSIFIPQAGKWIGCNIKDVIIGNKIINGDVYCKFMGWYISEGWSGKVTCKDKKQGYKMVITQKEGDNANDIRKVLNKMPYNYWEVDSKGIIQFCISNKDLYEHLFVFGKSKDKYIPKIIKNSTPEQINLFLNEYVKGDGYITPNQNIYLTTTSVNLINDLQEILIKTGRTGKISVLEYNGSVSYRIWVGINKNKSSRYKTLISKGQAQLEEYEGNVYCCSVPTGIIVIRRNNQTAISGNCMSVRGVRTPGSKTITTSLKGLFKTDAIVRQEFMTYISMESNK